LQRVTPGQAITRSGTIKTVLGRKTTGGASIIFLLSQRALFLLVDCGIDKKPRGADKPSDHVPVWCDLRL